MKKNAFNSVKMMAPRSNTFDLSHSVTMTGKMGHLMPCFIAECLPGDRWQLSCDNLIRFAPLVSPVMHRINSYVHYFFVPARIVWENFPEFLGDVENPLAPPTLLWDENVDPVYQKLGDYLGLPPCPPGGAAKKVSAIPFAAYQAIYNEYYRDQNLIPEVDYQLVDSDNTGNIAELCQIRNRAWEHDYFTAALPFAQKGDSVDLPLGNVELDPNWTVGAAAFPSFKNSALVPNPGNVIQTAGPAKIETGVSLAPMAYDPEGSLIIGSTTINDLRRAFRLQEWLEKNARGGTRYTEMIRVHFGVISSDARLQRPEYITGTKAPVMISEVLQTGETGTTPQGNMAGHGVSVGRGYQGNYFCEEHGYIIGIASVMPVPAYQQGIPRHWLRTLATDYYWGSFAHIGEQAIMNDEIYGYTANGDDTFGYIPRYSEYRYLQSRTAGDFRTTLDFWTLTRIFNNLPVLNEEFVEVIPEDAERIFAVQSGEDYLYMIYQHDVKAVRKIPVYGTPML